MPGSGWGAGHCSKGRGVLVFQREGEPVRKNGSEAAVDWQAKVLGEINPFKN